MTATPLPLWTASDIARATGGKTAGTWQANGIAMDSRAVNNGDVFIALKSSDFPKLRGGDGAADAHQYATAALAAGAAGAIVERVPNDMDANDPRLIIVPSTRQALIDLGIAARARMGGKTIGITGSVGKTSTRDMLSLVCGTFGKTHTSRENFNNIIGVPFTLANLPDATDYALIEMGMDSAGEMTELTKIARPDIAIITAIAPAHIGNFKNGIEGIADAKAEIFSGVAPTGTAILNRDDDQFARLLAHARTAGIQNILTFGEHADADARLVGCIEARNGTRATVHMAGEVIEFFIPAGKHQALNALAVLLTIQAAGLDVKKAADTLANFAPVEGRGHEEKLNIGDADNPVVLIDESYNASPTAMGAAFRVMALIDPGRGGRRIAILGDMLELGNHGPKLHADLALPIRAANIDLVYTCGTLMKNLYDALPANQRGAHKDTSTELAQIVPDVLVPGDVVMVKGSKSSRMDLVVEALRALPARKAATTQDKGQNRHAL